MPKVSSYLSDTAIHEKSLLSQLAAGEISASNFTTLPAGDQTFLEQYLFNQYAQNVSAYEAMSAIEFMVFGFASLFFQLYPNPPAPLSSGASQLYSAIQTIVSGYNFPLTSGTWQIPYLEEQVQLVLQNRDNYFQEKAKITGA